MEASALTRASRGGLLARRSPLLRFEPDDRLVKLIRAGHDGAFEALFNRYHSRLLAFCTSMLKSRQDAEDVLQEVFANAHAAMLNDDRPINVRPWLYRIARNRCLNHLRKPVPEGQDSMDIHPHQGGTTTAEEVQNREDLREVLADVRTLPETQRTALLLREIDQLSYEEIAVAMDTTVPSIKSLLVRARIGLAESSKARMLTCGEVQVELAEAAEGVAKASGPARKHVRTCDDCREFRNQLRADRKALAALFPFGPIALIKGGFLAKLFGGGSAAGTSGAAASGGAAATGAAATGGAGAVGAASAAVPPVRRCRRCGRRCRGRSERRRLRRRHGRPRLSAGRQGRGRRRHRRADHRRRGRGSQPRQPRRGDAGASRERPGAHPGPHGRPPQRPPQLPT
ncbi:MAG: RNA polymerase sigma factor [Thermoleophilales bacterium]|nr:RNA polymerase sigma factor [Thermoleophilales bacterium]